MSGVLYFVCLASMAALLASGALCLYRLIRGPAAADRAVALDTLTMVAIGLISVLSIVWDSLLYFDAVWILTLVGYLSSAAIALYLERGRIF